ncbi:MAG: phospho-N-acetylmuramoyl-pentapeptide-transferase [Armatimonadota bacterium]|nr:phospho-N-acetylmuramoyl-pentapeptide-transferase [Armatimonadota bacterium]MCX7777578.1 phospho-N-acetylmuramoyl-pentapeptide-transferase [Armatimonadota bacterium]MDW8025587.1 phospho-N-acetylmuramoyl-pentapeptide-transferase [Armatimonadota bacterium]
MHTGAFHPMLNLSAYMLIPTIALSACLCAVWIKIAKTLPWRRDVREDVPERHRGKVGTPTMGGLAFVISAALTCTATAIIIRRYDSSRSNAILLLVLVLVLFALLGAIDDMCKGITGRGIKARYKLLWQGACGLLIVALLMYEFELPTTFGAGELGWLYLPFGVLLIMASSNAMNLTDGLDGLACGISIISLLTLSAISVILNGTKPYAISAAAACVVLAGALFGFLPFNIHPAKVFMGDTGSLSLGAFICAASMLMKLELLWLLIALVPFIEMLSVVIQVISYKTTKRRVFPITPIHHSFEQMGWSEWRIVLTFWACTAFCAVCAISIAALASRV